MAREGTSTRNPGVVIRPEDLAKYYTGTVLDAIGEPILNDEADLTGHLQPATISTIFYYDKYRNLIPLDWKTQIDQYLIINNNTLSAKTRIEAIDERMASLTAFAQKLVEFGMVVSKGSASFKATITGVSIVFSLLNKAFGAFAKIFFTALSWSGTRADAELISKVTTAVKKLEREANALLTARAALVDQLAEELPETAANLAEYQSTNTLNNPEGTRSADTGNNTTIFLLALGIVGYLLYRKKH